MPGLESIGHMQGKLSFLFSVLSINNYWLVFKAMFHHFARATINEGHKLESLKQQTAKNLLVSSMGALNYSKQVYLSSETLVMINPCFFLALHPWSFLVGRYIPLTCLKCPFCIRTHYIALGTFTFFFKL